MANSTLIQVRASEQDKQEAAKILENLGTNISSVVNMLLKQIILTESIPFDIKMRNKDESMIKEVAATMQLEGMNLDAEDIEMLRRYRSGRATGDDLRLKIMKELGKADE